jgi:hypothetical protein
MAVQSSQLKSAASFSLAPLKSKNPAFRGVLAVICNLSSALTYSNSWWDVLLNLAPRSLSVKLLMRMGAYPG